MKTASDHGARLEPLQTRDLASVHGGWDPYDHPERPRFTENPAWKWGVNQTLNSWYEGANRGQVAKNVGNLPQMAQRD